MTHQENEYPERADAFIELGLPNQKISNATTRLDKEICICGHAVSKHTIYASGDINCYPAKMWCPCQEIEAVVEVQDTRHFLHKTRGFGRYHALGLGLASLSKNDKWSKLIARKECRMCSEECDQLTPVALNVQWQISRKPERNNGLVCDSCLQRLVEVR